MIRTVFGKVLSIIILVLVISFTVTGVLMNAGLHQFVADQKSQQLKNTGDRVINALEVYLKSNEIRDPHLYESFIQTLARNTDSVIWIVRTDGAILLSSDIPSSVKNKLETTEDGLPKLPDERQYDPSLHYKQGDFLGLFKNTGVEWLTYGQGFTIRHIPPYDSEAQGMVLVHTQIPSIYKTKYSILWIFFASGAVGAAIALLFVTLLSRRITKPLHQMKQMARRVASGEFTERLTVKGKDEISELSESFNNMVVALENIEQMRRDFISNVSHELRTPITTIKGFIEGILDGVIPSERQADYLSIVRDEVRRMQNLVNDLLDLAKMQAGEVQLKLTDFDIHELIRRSVISLQQFFEEKNLEFTADFETERMYVRADKEAIQRVILNLLQNAVKFTQQNGEIKVKTFVEKDKAIISVEDNGKGIPAEELPYIFERFYKTDKSRSMDKSGVGLGLAIVRNILVSHDETIKVESQEGYGSRFIFTLRSVSKVEPY
ncbi:MAG: HAMP domain-containing histidine kinase [Clostridia bacterium]|nr:HAMP domain-containing histidine kinase [Clostridia bacterium]